MDQFGLHDALHLNEGAISAAWDDADKTWTIETEKGARETFDAIVPALGQLSRPTLPAIAGIDSFAGAKWHAAEWPAADDLAGKRVGVIGSAASAVQFIPEIAQEAAALVVFQRTPNWVIPRKDEAVTDETKALMATNMPVAMKLGAGQRAMIFDNADAFFWQAFQWTPEGRAAFTRTAMDHLEAQVPDAALRAKLTPDYPIGCKRILITDDFYPALMRDNVTLETAAIERIEPNGVRTAASFHELDALIFATGFETTQWDWSMEVAGEGGVTLREAWANGPEAYLGIMVAGFPNMFVLYGPNTNLGHNSISFMIEAQVGFMLKALEALGGGGCKGCGRHRRGPASLQRSHRAVAGWNGVGRSALPQLVQGGDGRVYQNWSGDCASYAAETAEIDREVVALT